MDTETNDVDQAPSAGPQRGEPGLHAEVAAWLRGQGLAIEEQVACRAGKADIVLADRSVVYEIKHRLNRNTLFHALGQIQLYRQDINPQARGVIVGYATRDTAVLAPLIEHFNVEVMCWQEPPRISTPAVSMVPLASPAPDPQPPLRWNVAQLAMERGFVTVPSLSAQMHMLRQGLYKFWKNEAGQVAIDVVGRLTCALDADPGDWFRWVDTPDGRVLAWAIAARMEACGLGPMQLGRQSNIYMRSLTPILRGTAESVTLRTLARLARTFAQYGPFSVGTLLCWQTPDQPEAPVLGIRPRAKRTTTDD